MDLKFELDGGKTATLPSGSPARELVRAVKEASGAKKVFALKIDGKIVDFHTPLLAGGKAEPVVPGTPDALEVLRHTCAHVLAQAVARKFGKDAVEFAIGPVIDDGFYYDFDVDRPFTTDDIAGFEAEMAKIVKEDLAISRTEEPTKEAALARLAASGRAKFKSEIVRELPSDARVSFYTQGEFTDMCRGPHLPSTGAIGNGFKLLSVAGAYWRGDEKRESLQRIYGTAFSTKAELDDFVHLREEAKRRDHRVLGRELQLFTFPDESVGAPIWLPNGMVAWRALETMMREKLSARGYVEVRTPILLDTSVWRTTGHMSHYRENMFFVDPREEMKRADPKPTEKQLAEADPVVGMKPMNCPGSAMAYRTDIRSYRDLPLRLAEFGNCHRNEMSGVMSGLTRVRAFTQDDAHIYCTLEQMDAEMLSLVEFVREVYSQLGFAEIRMYFATRPPSSTGTDEMWQRSEAAIEGVLKKTGSPYHLDPGGGAFYGPKIDFKVLDSLKREWQLATIQADFGLAEKFDLHYVDKDGTRKRPVVIHRAILGSFERMFGILVEHWGGAFPAWLSPEQARLVPISEERHTDACKKALAALTHAGLRATADLRNQKMGAKVREATLQKVNYVLVIGDKEAELGSVSVRRRDGTNVGVMKVERFVALLKTESESRSATPLLQPIEGGATPGATSEKRAATGDMTAVRLTGPGDAQLLSDVKVPEPGPGEVRVRVLASGICGTDKHLCSGDASVVEKAKPPRTLGHEFCGEIESVGPGVAAEWRTGDYVTAEMHVVCGTCYQCRTGQGHVCENTVICGLHRDGCFANFVIVPASNLIRLDRASVPLKVGAFLDALGNAVHTASATDVPGRSIAVLGYGPIGAMTAAVVEFMGAAQVFITEVNPYNLNEARRWAAMKNAAHPRGLERVVVLDTGSAEKRQAALAAIQERTGGAGVDAALEISGHPDAINDGIAMLRWGGELVELGIGKDKAVTLHDWNGGVVFKGRTIKGIIGRRMYDTWYRMLGLLKAGLSVEHIVTHEAKLSDFNDAMGKFRRNETMKVVLYP